MEHLEVLVFELLKENHGEVIAAIGKALVARGWSTVVDVMKVTGLQFSAVKDALLVMIQHNIVQFREEKTTARAVTEYELRPEHVLARLRFPRYLAHSKALYGDEGEVITEELLEHGRLNKVEIVNQALQIACRLRGSVVTEEMTLRFQETFLKLQRAGYLARVEPRAASSSAEDAQVRSAAPVSSTPTKEDEEDGKGKTRTQKRKAPASAKKPATPKSSSKPEAAKPKGKGKAKAAAPSAPPELAMMAAKEQSENDESEERPKKRQAVVPALAAAAGPASGSEAPTLDVKTAFGAISAEAFWRVNYDKYDLAFRKEACATLVAEKIHPLAGTIVRAIYHLTEPISDYKIDDCTPQVSANAIAEAVIREDPTQTKENINLYLDLISSDKAGIMRKVAATDEDKNYVKVAETVVLDKFGPMGLRIFRLLIMKKQLEQKQVSDLAMLPLKDAREKLYELLAADYCYLQEVPKASDHAPYHTYYLWSIKLPQLYLTLQAELYKTMKNLKQREQHELLQADELLKKSEEERLVNVDGTKQLLTEQERQALDSLSKVEDRISHTLLSLDYSLMVLRDF